MSDGYQLVQLKNGSWSVRSLVAAETFHPVVGPVEEADALYVQQLRLPERFAATGDTPFVIWDVGLGAAANVLVVLNSLRHLAGRIRVVSFDHTLEPLRFAAAHAEKLGYLVPFSAAVERLLAEGRVEFDNGESRVEWEVHPGDFPERLAAPNAVNWPRPHAILFDAYSPARNPAMWTLPLFTRLRELADPDTPCALATYSRATLLRVTLLRAGWFVGVGHATGEKNETTLAANRPELISEPLGPTFLDRANRSSSAEPMPGPTYQQHPLSEVSRQAIAAHPQFQVTSPTRADATAPAA